MKENCLCLIAVCKLDTPDVILNFFLHVNVMGHSQGILLLLV